MFLKVQAFSRVVDEVIRCSPIWKEADCYNPLPIEMAISFMKIMRLKTGPFLPSSCPDRANNRNNYP